MEKPRWLTPKTEPFPEDSQIFGKILTPKGNDIFDLRDDLNACRREHPARAEPDNQDPLWAEIEDLKRMMR